VYANLDKMATETSATQTDFAQTTSIVLDPKFNTWDRIVVENLQADADEDRDRKDLDALRALNDPKHEAFEPTVFASIDFDALPSILSGWLLKPFISLARRLVRVETDVIMVSRDRKPSHWYFLTLLS